MKELLARVRAMTRRKGTYEGTPIRWEDLTLDPATFALSARNSVRLSVKEYELAESLFANPDAALTSEYLLDRVWRGEGGADANTVWLYVSYLKGKLRSVGSSVSVEGAKGGPYRLTMTGGGNDERT